MDGWREGGREGGKKEKGERGARKRRERSRLSLNLYIARDYRALPCIRRGYPAPSARASFDAPRRGGMVKKLGAATAHCPAPPGAPPVRLSHVLSLEAKKRIVLKNGACEGKRNARGRGGMGAKGREMFAEECEGFSCAVSLDPCPWGMQSKDAQPVRRTRLLSSAGDAGCTEQCAACRLRSRWRGKGRGRLLQL